MTVRQNNFLASLRDLPALIKKSFRWFIYCHNHSLGLKPHLSTRWTGQTRLTNSQGGIHESWMGRWSPRAPGFSREQYAEYLEMSTLQQNIVTSQFIEYCIDDFHYVSK